MSYHENNHLIYEYIDVNGISPFASWFTILDDWTAQKVVVAIARLEIGIFTHCKSLRQGLWEIKLAHGPGIRIYFGKRAQKILLLWGGTKNQQSKDIYRARKYWSDYLKYGEHVAWH